MSNPRTGRFDIATASGWRNFGVLLAAVAAFTGVGPLVSELTITVPEDEEASVQIALTNSTAVAPANDNVTNFVLPASGKAFENVNLDCVWIKAPSADSVIEFVLRP